MLATVFVETLVGFLAIVVTEVPAVLAGGNVGTTKAGSAGMLSVGITSVGVANTGMLRTLGAVSVGTAKTGKVSLGNVGATNVGATSTGVVEVSTGVSSALTFWPKHTLTSAAIAIISFFTSILSIGIVFP